MVQKPSFKSKFLKLGLVHSLSGLLYLQKDIFNKIRRIFPDCYKFSAAGFKRVFYRADICACLTGNFIS